MSIINNDNLKISLCDNCNLDVNLSIRPKIIDETTTEIWIKSKQKFNNEHLMKNILDSIIVTDYQIKDLKKQTKIWKSILADISKDIENVNAIEDDAKRIEAKYYLKIKKAEIEENLNTMFIAKIEDVNQGVTKNKKLSFSILIIISISLGILLSIFLSLIISFFLKIKSI